LQSSLCPAGVAVGGSRGAMPYPVAGSNAGEATAVAGGAIAAAAIAGGERTSSLGPPLMSTTGSAAVHSSHLGGLFRDMHESLGRLASDTEEIRRGIAQNDESLREEIEDIDKEIDDEIYERKDAFNQMTLEFENFSHRKAEKVVQELEEFTKEQLVKDSARARQIAALMKEMDRLKLHLGCIGNTWSRLVTSISDPTRRTKGEQLHDEDEGESLPAAWNSARS